MISTRGQIDQIITSIIVVFVAIFLSGLFLGVSSNIAQVAGVGTSTSPLVTHYDTGASRAYFDLFLSEELSIAQERVSVRDSFSVISNAVYSERDFEDVRASLALEALYTRFNDVYACDGSHRFVFLVKDPSGSAQRGTYWSYINYPARTFSSTLYPPEWQVNIIDAVNGKATQPELYSDSSFDFTQGLALTLPPGYIVYPQGIDIVNELPPFIVIFYGERPC